MKSLKRSKKQSAEPKEAAIPLPRGKDQPKPKEHTSHARPLWLYFVPSLFIVAMVLALLVFTTQRSVEQVQSAELAKQAEIAARGLALQLGVAIDARRVQLRLLANSPSLQASLSENADPLLLARAAKAAEGLLPGVAQLRLFVVGQEPKPDPQGDTPMGYAGVDMVKHAMLGRATLAEVHQLSSGTPYVALAEPAAKDGKVQGVLFAVWPISVLQSVMAGAADFPGDFQLLQKSAAVLAGAARNDQVLIPTGNEAVPGSIWQIVYSARGELDSSVWMHVLLVAAAAMLVLALGLVLQVRFLGRALREDMSAAVNLGESILNGKNAGQPQARVSVTQDALLLLAQYARTARSQERGDPARAGTSLESSLTGGSGKPTQRRSRGAARQAEAVAPAEDVQVPASIFRAYDVRGVVERDFQPALVRILGQAFAAEARDRSLDQIWVACDARPSSPKLYESIIEGLLAQGMQVLELGQVPMGVLYHAMQSERHCGAVMVTGSHNPAEYNGFKLFLLGEPVQGDDIQALRTRMIKGRFAPAKRQGARKLRDLHDSYLETATEEVQLPRPLKVVVDGGNGVAGELACALLQQLGCEVHPLFCEPDGEFPNHHPDPSDPDNLTALGLEVQAQEADIGLAFDGDGDRIGAVDNVGEPVRPEHLLMLLAGDILLRHPGVDVVFDVKSSRHLASYILASGGRPIMWRSGRSRMRNKMNETGALLGGEFSGHIFIRERWNGSDDAIYVAARLVEVVATEEQPLNELLAGLPSSPATPEYQLPLAEGESDQLMQAIAASGVFANAKVLDLDGLRVEFDHGWGLVRKSNTVPSLTFRFEADTEAALEQIKQTFRDLLQKVAASHALPF